MTLEVIMHLEVIFGLWLGEKDLQAGVIGREGCYARKT